MTPEDFDKLLSSRIQKINDVLSNKSKEYAFGNDRLFNFKAAARINQNTPQESLWGMATKHLVCVQDLVEGRLYNTEANANEKIGDLINYLILLEAVLLEARTILKQESVNLQPEAKIKYKYGKCNSSFER